MPHFRVDDGLDSHPKIQRAGDEALGLWVRAGSWCMRYLTDGFVPSWWVKQQPRGTVKAKKLVSVGLWEDGAERDGEKGYQFHEFIGPGRQDSRNQIEADRRSSAARQEVARNPQLRAAIRKRDGDVCRYCETPVEWNNRRGPTGGTYDHVDPEGGTVIDNLVVCCRGCNSRKGRRTPEQAGLQLHPPKPEYRSSSELKRESENESEKSRSVLSPNPTQPNPTQRSTSLVVTSGGVGTKADARDPNRPHPPRCPKHADDPSPPPCGDCADARRTADAHTAELDQAAADQRAARTAEIAACPDCDERGWIDTGNAVTRCPNHDWSLTHA